MDVKSVIESLLFVSGEPVALERIAAVVEQPVRVVRQHITDLQTEYALRGAGIQLVFAENTVQFATLRENAPYVEKMLNTSKAKGLSRSALEILGVIAYNQPITKAQIDAIRGVKSDRPLATLLERRLIREIGRLEKPGRPMTYGTTDTFLKVFGFVSLKELPELDAISQTFQEWSTM